MGRPKKQSGESTRTRLLRGAEEVFGTHGHARARLEDIAARAGIRRSSLLYHFGSKDALYAQVVTSVSSDLRERVKQATAEGGTPLERLEAVTKALTRFAEERRAGVSMFVRELLDRPLQGANHIDEFVAILDLIEQFVRAEAGNLLAAGLPLRATLLHIMVSQALRVASGELGEQLWRDASDPRPFVRALLSPEVMT